MLELNKIKIELYNDHFQNYKVYGIPKAKYFSDIERSYEWFLTI